LLERWPAWAWSLPVALLVALGVWAGAKVARALEARRAAWARRLGKAGARRALHLLARAGYEVEALEVSRSAWLLVDGEPRAFTARADAFVRRGSRRFVVEFKGGEENAAATQVATRRQLLEYAWVFGTESVLLVDAHAGRIHEVRFPEAS
jgi:hypothetical protein